MSNSKLEIGENGGDKNFLEHESKTAFFQNQFSVQKIFHLENTYFANNSKFNKNMFQFFGK